MRRTEPASAAPIEKLGLFIAENEDVLVKFSTVMAHNSAGDCKNTLTINDTEHFAPSGKNRTSLLTKGRYHPFIFDGLFNVAKVDGVHSFYANYHGIEKWIGTYYPDTNVLATSDLTHSVTGFPLLRRILEVIIEDYGPDKIEEKIVVELSLGGDPEFEVKVSGRIVEANTMISDPDNDRDIGLDGCSEVAELRPTPKKSPEDAVREVGRLLSESADMGLRLSHGGDCYAIGYHIHFGGISYVPETDMRFLKVLDVALNENLRHLNGGARGGYAGCSQYERKYYGFEYRSLPAGIASHPRLLEYTLRIAFNLAKKWWQNEELPEPSAAIPEDYWDEAGLTPHEAEEFSGLIADYNPDADLYAAWEIDTVRAKAPSTNPISFSDEWGAANKEALIGFLRDYFDGRPLPALHFYGLREDRGLAVAGVCVEGISSIPVGEVPHVDGFGIPWILRVSQLHSWVEGHGKSHTAESWLAVIAQQVELLVTSDTFE